MQQPRKQATAVSETPDLSTYFSYAERRYHRCLSRGRKVHTRQPLASTDGCQTPRSSSLAGPFTDRAVAEALPQRMNFLMPLSLGLATQIRGTERRGRRTKDWPS